MESTNLYFNRIIRAAKLDADLYEEVEADKGALGQAAGVVVLSSIAAGIGAATTAGWPLSDGVSGLTLLILLARKSFLNHRPEPIMVNC